MGHQGKTANKSQNSPKGPQNLSPPLDPVMGLKLSSNNLVPSSIGEEGKGSEQGISLMKEERRERKNAWWEPLNDSSRPRDDTMAAKQDDDI